MPRNIASLYSEHERLTNRIFAGPPLTTADRKRLRRVRNKLLRIEAKNRTNESRVVKIGAEELKVRWLWSSYPIGSRAISHNGNWWEKTPAGWKANSGDVFPTPGADVCRVIVKENNA